MAWRRLSVAADILPAVEPARPARRRKRPPGRPHWKIHNCTGFSSFFPGGGTPALYGSRDGRRHNVFTAFIPEWRSPVRIALMTIARQLRILKNPDLSVTCPQKYLCME